MPVLKFKDKDGVVKTTPGLKIVTEKTQVNPNLNIHFGQVAPEDTSKLWVKTNKYPNDIIISPKTIPQNNTITYEINELPSADYGIGVAAVNNVIYLFGGAVSGNIIRKFYPDTGELITLNTVLTKPGAYKKPVVYGELIYLFHYDNTGTADIFNTKTETIVSIPSSALQYGEVVLVGNKMYSFGSYNGTGIKVYDIESNTWSDCRVSLPQSGKDLCTAVYGSKIYLFGRTYSDVWGYWYGRQNICIFDTETLTFSEPLAQYPDDDMYMSSVTVGTKVYLFGGGTGLHGTRRDTIWVYDLLTDSFSLLDTVLKNPAYKISTVLCGNDIYLIGGSGASSSLKAIDKFSLCSYLPENSLHVQTSIGGGSLSKIILNPLVETNINKVFLGNKNNYAEEIESYVYDYVPQFIHNTNKKYTSNCVWSSDVTTFSTSVECSVGDLIIASIITRDTLSLSDGWTLISTSNINNADTDNQRLSFAYKYAENEIETITVTQSTKNIIYITLVSLQNATGFIDNGYSYVNDKTATSISITKTQGLTLFGCAAPNWYSSTPIPPWKVSDNSEIIQLQNSSIPRLGIVLDQNEGLNEITITGSGTGSTFIVGSLTITGMDKFYDVDEWSGGEMWKLL